MKRTILLAIALFSAGLLHAGPKEIETRTATHSVSVTNATSIDIQGKYTYMEIETWDKNEVRIDARVTFTGRVTDRVQKFLNEFEKNVMDGVKKSGNELTINTRLEEPNRVQIGSRNVGINIGYGEKELSIEYTIKVPGTNTLSIKGAYRDIVMNGAYDDVEVTQYSADLIAGNFKKAKLNLKYGDAKIDYIANGVVETYEQELEVDEIESINLNSKYSELVLHELQEMTAKGYETDFTINRIEILKGDLKYGNMKVKTKLSQGVLTLYEFDIDAEAIGNLRLDNSKYSKLNIDRANEIRFIESYEDKLTIRYLNNLISKSKYGKHTIEQLGGFIELNGYEEDLKINDVANKASRIDIDGKYINLDIDLSGTKFSLNTNLKYGKVDYDESAVVISKHIQENSNLTLELKSKQAGENEFQLRIRGYEVDVDLN